MPTLPSASPTRRRIYLMRHGSVDYFRADGSAVLPHTVALTARGVAEADAAGQAFAAAGVRFDHAVCSGLLRTLQTAERVLAAQAPGSAPAPALGCDERLQEIRPGRLDRIPRDGLAAAFTEVFSAADGDVERHRFLGGESIGELLDRVLPAFDAILANPAWTTLLLVLHGGVNRALLSRALSGRRAFFGRFEQAPACINIVDVGPEDDDMVVRAVNLAPTDWLQADDRMTTMERLLGQYAAAAAPITR